MNRGNSLSLEAKMSFLTMRHRFHHASHLEEQPVYQSGTVSEEEALLLIGICRCFRPSLVSY